MKKNALLFLLPLLMLDTHPKTRTSFNGGSLVNETSRAFRQLALTLRTQEPWRFDVKIPAGGHTLRIACMDAGSRSPYDLGNLVDAGFMKKK